MGHHDHRLDQPDHSPHAQHRLEDDHRQQQSGKPRGIFVRPAYRLYQQNQLGGQKQTHGEFVVRGEKPSETGVGGNGKRHQAGGADDAGDAEPALARGNDRQREHQQTERGGDMPMELLAPGFVHLNRPLEHGVGRSHLMILHRPGGAPVAGRPIGAAQAGVGQTHEAAEHDDAESQQGGGPRDTVEMLIGVGHGSILRVLPGLYAIRTDQIRLCSAESRIHRNPPHTPESRQRFHVRAKHPARRRPASARSP